MPLPASPTAKPWPPRYSRSIARTDGSSSTISTRVACVHARDLRCRRIHQCRYTTDNTRCGGLTHRRIPALPTLPARPCRTRHRKEHHHDTPSATATERYAKVIEVSKRVRWDIERDVIRGRRFDYSKTFLPDGLSLVDELDVPERRPTSAC